ncbi:MAG: hypothetical protein U9O63_06725 [Actinomycetota bacterium]|nr:hypothetical protein [Actinomycetota bacterium]
MATGDVSFAPKHSQIGRLWGGLLALSYPALLVLMVVTVGFRRGGDGTDFAASFVGSVLFLIAAPTAWIFSFDFIEVTRLTVIVLGVVTSLPIWYLLGAALGERSASLGVWLRRYLTICVVWTALNILFLGLLASLV